jgi:hypothetical protein
MKNLMNKPEEESSSKVTLDDLSKNFTMMFLEPIKISHRNQKFQEGSAFWRHFDGLWTILRRICYAELCVYDFHRIWVEIVSQHVFGYSGYYTDLRELDFNVFGGKGGKEELDEYFAVWERIWAIVSSRL